MKVQFNRGQEYSDIWTQASDKVITQFYFNYIIIIPHSKMYTKASDAISWSITTWTPR